MAIDMGRKSQSGNDAMGLGRARVRVFSNIMLSAQIVDGES